MKTLARGGCWPNENQLTLLRAAVLPDSRALHCFETWLLSNSIDTADHASHRILASVHRNLASLGYDHAHAARLAGLRRYTWFHVQRKLRDASTILRALHEDGSSTLLLKGAALECHYANAPGVRPMSDVDILVPTARAQQAMDTLSRCGFRALVPRPSELVGIRHSAPFVRGELELDLHWLPLLESCDVGAQWAWEGSLPADCFGVPTRVLAPAEQLFHTLAHGICFNHLPPLRWAVDAALVLRCDAHLDHSRLIALARAHRLTKVVGAGLEFLRSELELEVPCNVTRELRSLPDGLGQELEYLCRTRRVEVLGQLPGMLTHYVRITRGTPVDQRVLGLPDYLRRSWQLASLAELCFALPRKASGRMRDWLAR